MIKKSLWIHNILVPISEIADPKYQERAWIAREFHEYSSFQDTICRLYDDACFEDFVDFQAERFDLPRALILKLQKFKTALDEYLDRTDTFIDEQDLIKDPAWKGIQLLAQEVITEFKQAGFSS